jgi:hypothetical protein
MRNTATRTVSRYSTRTAGWPAVSTWPGELERRMPDSTLHLQAGGHSLAHLYYRDIFEALRSS